MLDELDSQSSTGIADYWGMLVRRRWLVLAPLFVCWAIAWAVSWLIPSSYKSEALILVEQQKVPEQYVVPNVSVSLQDRLQNMTQEILSRTRLQSTINRFHLYSERHGFRKLLPGGDPVEQMRKDIKIDLVDSAARHEQLTAFKIDYSADSPQLAQQVNSELTSLFIEENLKLQQQLSESTTAFLQNELEEARKKLEQQEAKVRAFKAGHLGDLPSQAETNVQILTGLQNQLLSTQRALDGAKQQRLYLESLQQQYQTAQANLGTSENSPVSPLVSLNLELAHLRQQLEEARTRFTEEYPDVVELKDKIAKAEKRKKELEAEPTAAPEPSKSINALNPVAAAEVQRGSTTPMMQVQSQLKANKLEIDNYDQHAKELESQIAAYRARLNLTPQTEQQLADVSRGYEESKTNYNSLLQKQNQSELATSLQQRQQGEQFRILDPPSLPGRPSSPNHLLISLGGLAVGGLIGLGLVVMKEMVNARIRKESELDGIVPTRVLVCIPHLTVPGENRFRPAFRWLEIATVSLMVLLILAGNLYALYKS